MMKINTLQIVPLRTANHFSIFSSNLKMILLVQNNESHKVPCSRSQLAISPVVIVIRKINKLLAVPKMVLKI